MEIFRKFNFFHWPADIINGCGKNEKDVNNFRCTKYRSCCHVLNTVLATVSIKKA